MKSLLIAAFLALPVMAQQSSTEPATEDESSSESVQAEPGPTSDSTPDYTPGALTLVLEDIPLEEESSETSTSGIELLTTDQWRVRFNFMLSPLSHDSGLNGPILSRIFSPFTLLGMDYAPAGYAGDEWAPGDLTWTQRRYRWQMIQRVNAANRRDNSLFPISLR